MCRRGRGWGGGGGGRVAVFPQGYTEEVTPSHPPTQTGEYGIYRHSDSINLSLCAFPITVTHRDFNLMIAVHPTETVHSLKDRLESEGVGAASTHTLFWNKAPLSPSQRLCDVLIPAHANLIYVNEHSAAEISSSAAQVAVEAGAVTPEVSSGQKRKAVAPAPREGEDEDDSGENHPAAVQQTPPPPSLAVSGSRSARRRRRRAQRHRDSAALAAGSAKGVEAPDGEGPAYLAAAAFPPDSPESSPIAASQPRGGVLVPL